MRGLRGCLEDMGYATFVLARRGRPSLFQPGLVDTGADWSEPGVTVSTAHLIPEDEIKKWVFRNNISLVMTFQNYDFDSIRHLREMGIGTTGTFMWEDFSSDHAALAREAFTELFALSECDTARYRSWNLPVTHVPFFSTDIPQAEGMLKEARPKSLRLLFPGGTMSQRKALGGLLEAHQRLPKGLIELIVKSQRALTRKDLLTGNNYHQIIRTMKRLKHDDVSLRLPSNVRVIQRDISALALDQLLSSVDCVAALSRWEGLNVNIFDAMSRGIPVIATDMAPNSEMVIDGVNGFLVPADKIGERPNGLPILEPRVDALEDVLVRITRPGVIENLSQGMKQQSVRWERKRTMAALATLIDGINQRG